MDGIFVAYHNTQEMFGFEYLSLETMEQDIFGNAVVPRQQFEMSISLLEKVVEAVIDNLPHQDIELMISAPYNNKCNIYAIPKTRGPPIAFALSLVSTTNGVYTTNPYEQTADDEWRIYYDLKKVEFVEAVYLQQRKRIERLLTPLQRQSSFSDDLKEQLYPTDSVSFAQDVSAAEKGSL
jgi:hypothetical protein